MSDNTLHPGNANRPVKDVIHDAMKELLALTRRHFDRDPMVVKASIPADHLDSDVLIADALTMAALRIEELEEQYKSLRRKYETLAEG